MRKSRFTTEQIIGFIKQAGACPAVPAKTPRAARGGPWHGAARVRLSGAVACP